LSTSGPDCRLACNRVRAQKDFGVSERAFNRAWNAAIALTGSDWGNPGRRKS